MSTQQFVQRVRDTGGASMNIRSGKLLAPGKKAYVVGGEPDKSGAAIPPVSVDAGEFGESHVSAMLGNVRSATGNRARTNIGAWSDNGKVVLDASAVTKRPGEAIRKGKNRDQQSIWDNKHMREIDTGGHDGAGS